MTLKRAVAMPDCESGDVTAYFNERYPTVSRAPQVTNQALIDAGAEIGVPHWFALAVKPRFDKAVAITLERKGFETLIPLYKKHHKYGTRSKQSELPLFPGYVFCRFSVLCKQPILTTPGVTQILGNGKRPIPVSETEMISLRTVIRAQVPLYPFPFLQVGEKVRIEEGVLTGVVGVVVKLKESFRLVLSVTLLQRSVLLEVDGYQVSLERSAQHPRDVSMRDLRKF